MRDQKEVQSLDTEHRQEIHTMNAILTRNNILDVMRLITQVNNKLERLNDILHQIPGLDPTHMKAKYGTTDPFNFHTRFKEVDSAFKSLENKLLRDPNIPTPRLMLPVMNSSVDALPGRRMPQVEVEFPEYDFRAFLSGHATGMEDSDIEEGGGR